MSKRREVQHRIDAISEIYSIMTSMKNLATIEMGKITRYNEMQKRVMDSIGVALNEIRYHYASLSPVQEASPLYLIFGSERGFCGSYNEQLVSAIKHRTAGQNVLIIGVGSRLADPLQSEFANAICLPGAAVADEVVTVLSKVLAKMEELREQNVQFNLQVVHFTPDSHHPNCESVLPSVIKKPKSGMPPMINLPYPQLISELLEHYLFAVTHYWLFNALLCENQQRIHHLDQALHHLEQQTENLKKRRNRLRQEEIIEEIEVILLNSESIGTPKALQKN